jgi:hypothetical protein
MAIWLGGAGRSEAELARVLSESNGGKARNQNRRAHERYPLDNARGQLVHRGSKTPCQVLEISLSGCSLETEKPFRHGALAPVELVLPIMDMLLHIGGVTQWMKKDTQIGLRFTHVSFRSKDQLGALIACILGQRTQQSVIEMMVSLKLNQSTGDVLIAKPPEKAPEQPSLPPGPLPYNAQVHCGEGRILSPKEGEWKVLVQSPDGRYKSSGDFIDLSLGGCTIRSDKQFAGEVGDHLELNFELQCMRFLLSGITQAVYNTETVAIWFNNLGRRRREELEQVIGELATETRQKLEYP